MRFLFLEPFYGGSHKDFADGLISHSRHSIDLLTLPARFWKWRMRGAALYFANNVKSLKAYDGLITTDLMGLSDFKTLMGRSCPPSLVYFHENQITYPLAPGEKMDVHFGYTNITTALAADRVLFNSKTHYDAFFSDLPEFLNLMPEYRPKWVVEKIKKRSDILFPGCQFPSSVNPAEIHPKSDSPPLIIWNHRWEFDKVPSEFFHALDTVSKKRLDFRIALLGENFNKVPNEFLEAKDLHANRIVQYGFVESKSDYFEWLKQGSIVVSTAIQENFGISLIEAMRYGCLPILPNRLSYPEILPKEFHRDFLYNDQHELSEKLSVMLMDLLRLREKSQRLSNAMDRYSWENLIVKYDEELEKLAAKHEKRSH